MKLERALVFLDLEATGLNVSTDRIVELGLLKILPSGERKQSVRRFNPGMPIPPEVTEVHGITNEDVKDSPKFEDCAEAIWTWIRGCDIAGYNLWHFDLPMLWEEFNRAGYKWDWRAHRIVDAGQLFKIREERTLAAAVRFYCNREHEGAHGAMADALATAEVLEGQIQRYPDLAEADVEQLAAASQHKDELERVDLAGKLKRDKDGDIVYNFGDSKGKKVLDDLGLAHWMLRKDFPEETKIALRAEMERDAVYQAEQRKAQGTEVPA